MNFVQQSKILAVLKELSHCPSILDCWLKCSMQSFGLFFVSKSRCNISFVIAWLTFFSPYQIQVNLEVEEVGHFNEWPPLTTKYLKYWNIKINIRNYKFQKLFMNYHPRVSPNHLINFSFYFPKKKSRFLFSSILLQNIWIYSVLERNKLLQNYKSQGSSDVKSEEKNILHQVYRNPILKDTMFCKWA